MELFRESNYSPLKKQSWTKYGPYAMNKRKSGLTQASVIQELSDIHRILLELQGLAQWLRYREPKQSLSV